MISVKNLSKKFNKQEVLRNVSFEINKGEVVGFLGPNGAGKTTTMRILTGFIPMTSGLAKIDNLDVFEDSLKIRKKVGYLPETTPLYQDMTVNEYLKFIAEIKQVAKEKREEQITSCKQKCGLTEVEDKLIKTLSKGYKQRVGIAQALIGEPEVLILDEPTIGLDPKQIIEIRNLIKNLGKSKTVILSTHIMQEVSAVCDKVIIINEGRIVATDTPENLTSSLAGGMKVKLLVKGPAAEISRCLSSLDSVKKAEVISEKKDGVTIKIESEKNNDPRQVVASAIIRNNWGLLEMTQESMNLEDIFLKLTKN